MGNRNAADMAEQVRLGNVQELVALEWHLTGNHYPPLPAALAPTCQAAIEALRDEEPDREIEMPAGIAYRGRTSATAAEIAESAHLWCMV